jgi:hypothetical protein
VTRSERFAELLKRPGTNVATRQLCRPQTFIDAHRFAPYLHFDNTNRRGAHALLRFGLFESTQL